MTDVTGPNETLIKIREIRSKENINLQPSPYMKSHFVDESGEIIPIVVRNYQKQAILNMLCVEKMIESDDTGLGKAQPIDSKVLTLSGWAEIGRLKIGNKIFGANGKLTDVIGVYPQGKKQIYRVEMDDGSSTECCDEHLWTVRTTSTEISGKRWKTLSLRDIVISDICYRNNASRLKWEIPIVQPIEFPEASLIIDPYLLGVFAGNCGVVNELSIVSDDPELFDIVRSHLPLDCVFVKSIDSSLRYIAGRDSGYNSQE